MTVFLVLAALIGVISFALRVRTDGGGTHRAHDRHHKLPTQAVRARPVIAMELDPSCRTCAYEIELRRAGRTAGSRR